MAAGTPPKRVLMASEVCLREGALEVFLCKKNTKEHEAILRADYDARLIHELLLLAGAAVLVIPGESLAQRGGASPLETRTVFGTLRPTRPDRAGGTTHRLRSDTGDGDQGRGRGPDP